MSMRTVREPLSDLREKIERKHPQVKESFSEFQRQWDEFERRQRNSRGAGPETADLWQPTFKEYK